MAVTILIPFFERLSLKGKVLQGLVPDDLDHTEVCRGRSVVYVLAGNRRNYLRRAVINSVRADIRCSASRIIASFQFVGGERKAELPGSSRARRTVASDIPVSAAISASVCPSVRR